MPESTKRVKFVSEKPKPLPEIDLRKRSGPSSNPGKDRAEAFAELKREKPMLQAQFDEISGAPSYLQETGKFLTGKNPNLPAKVVVKNYVNRFPGLFGHGADALDAAKVTREDVTAHNGMTTLVWQQQHAGIPLFNTIFKANVTQNGELVTVSDHFLGDPAAAAGNQDAVPGLSVQEAISKAAAGLGDVVAAAAISAKGTPSGAEQKQSFTAEKLSDTTALLTWMPISAGEMKLAWDVTTFSLARNEMFQTVVDAESGELLYRRSLTADISDASYRVYADGTTKQPFDSPMPLSPGHSTPLSTQPPEVPRQLLTMQALDTTASPEGWIPDGGTTTLGNNVQAHTDTDANNVADLPRPTSATRVFDFPVDFTQPPTAYKDALVTQLFYMNNWVHDKMYALGFTESAGNFQTNNFGRGGLGNDAVQADAQDGSGTNNANFSTPSDGSPGRMQMFIWTSPNPDRDSDFDDEIIIHEYGHGISNRLVGGGVGISALQSRGMGEGWSDFYALSLLSQPGDDVNGNYAEGGYSLYLLSGMTTNYYFGIRRYPYGPDMTKSPLTFRDIDPTQARPHTGIPLSPRYGSSNGDPSQYHGQGEVWCNMLWEVRRNLVIRHGFATGNQLALQLVTDGLKLTPANPNFIQSRDAILQADLVNNGGANRLDIWTGFAKRGLGASASSPGSSTTTGVVESYDLPDDLSVSPTTALTATGNAGGPFSPGSQLYTLTNTGTAALNWTATKTQAWLTLSSSGGSLAGSGTASVTATINSAANALLDGTYTDTVTFTNSTSGAVITRAVTLRVGVKDYFTELFDTSANDTDNQSWLFTPNGSSNFYSVQRTAATVFPTDPTGGTTLVLGDDNFVSVILSGGVSVKLYGASHTTFYVGSNGYLTFGTGDGSLSSSFSAHFTYPRVAALMQDLDPRTQGTISWRQLADRIAVTYLNVPRYGTSDSNNFQFEMYFDGRVRITCLGIASTAGLIGLSQGLGTPVDFAESDFSSYSSLQLGLALPATATEGDGVLVGAGTVNVSSAQVADVTVALTSSNTGKVTVPVTVTVPAGQTSATFNLTILDNGVLDGTQSVTINATATAAGAAAGTVAVQDNETAALAVSAPPSTSEGAGTLTGTVSVSVAPASAITVGLTSSDTTEIQVPATATILAGQTSGTFTITVVNDNEIDGPKNATITAHIANWTDGTATINVLDNENTNLVLTLPPAVSEGAAGVGSVAISGTLTTGLTVSLASDNARLTLPATVTLPAGSTSVSVTLTAPDNGVQDGSQVVNVSANAAGFNSAAGTTTVLDNDLNHFVIAPIGVSQAAGVAFSVTITAKDLNGVTIPNYVGTPALSAAGTAGAVTVTPVTAGPFSSGVWTGSVTASTISDNVVLTVNDGAGHTGTSNAFNITGGPVHHFAWSAISSPKVKDAPFPVTVTAQDQYNNTATSFGGIADISGFVGGAPVSPVQVLTFTAYADLTVGGEYQRAKEAISAHFTDYVETTTTATDPVLLAAALAGKHVFLIVEQETALSSQLGALGTSWAGTLTNFVNNGGIVIVCSWQLDEHLILTNAGLINATKGTAPSAASLTKASTTVLNTGVTTPFSGSYLSYYTSTNGVASLQDATSAVPVVLHRDVGSGHVVIIGTDYYTTGTGMDRVLANAVAWAQTTGTPIPVSPTQTPAFVNGQWTGTASVLQSASQVTLRVRDSAGHTGDSSAFDVLAIGSLAVSVPPSAAEGSSPVSGTISVTPAPTADLTVNLSSSDISEATVPATVTITAGQTSATFSLSVMEDALLDGAQPALITAAASGYDSGSGTISITDNETAVLAVTLPATVTEGQGTLATGGTVSVTPTPTTAVTVGLASSNTGEITVPATVTIPAGASSATFPVTVVNDTLTDGTQSVSVTAQVSGWTDGVGTTSVLDNDLHHFGIANIASPKTVNLAFNVVITAQTVDNVTISSYTGTAALTAGGAGGPVTITPTTTGTFSAGLRTVAVTVSTADTDVVLTVNDGAGHTGTSNAFNVGAGPLNHFAWSTVASPQPAGNPFSVTVTAKDVGNNTVTGFTGTANLSGYALSGVASSVVITEMNPNSPDEIEFMNVGTTAVDVSGWQVYIYDNVSGNVTPLTVFTIPAGSSCAAGQIFRLQESGTSPGAFPLFFYGANVDWTTVNTSQTAVLLRNAAGVVVDFAVANASTAAAITSPQTIPAAQWTGTSIPVPVVTTNGYSRVGSQDGNTATDWVAATSGMGTANAGLTVPFGTPSPVTITPTLSGAFTAGVWTGNMTVTQQAVQMRLRADDGAGKTGDSNAFDVTGTLAANAQSVTVPHNTATAVTLTGQDTANPGATLTYTVATNPTRGVLSGTAPNLTYTPNAGQSGADSFTFTVANGGVTSNPATVSLTVQTAPPEIAVEEPVGAGLSDGTSTVNFGTVNEASNLVKTFTVRNTGAQTLTISGITKDGANGADFTVGALSSSSIAPAGSATFTVTFLPTAAGARTAALHIGSNDADENPFDIALTGTGANFGAGEIAVEVPEWTEITSGGPAVSFGNATLGSGWTRRFVIRNKGSGALTVSGVTVDGANAGDFQLVPVASTAMPAGTTLLVDVSFVPTATGTRNAALHVLSSDPDESSFDIAVTGASTLGNTQTIQMARDINTTSGNHTVGSNVQMDGYVLYNGYTATTGNELFRTDGTAAGTYMIRDMIPGVGAGSPNLFTRIGDRAFFRANASTSPSTGTELWVTDGTDAGTMLLKDIFPGSSSSSPLNLVNVNGTLFFAAADGTTGGTFGTELWKSDGTAAGTVLVKDINLTAATGSSSANFVNVDGTLFFTANDGVSGTELWKSDGTEAGTVMVRDLTAGATGSTLSNLTALGSTLFFTNTDTATGNELWKSDGTSAGTVMVADIDPGTASSSPAALVVMGGALYFRATTVANGTELWRSDGTLAGTLMVKDVSAGTLSGVTATLSVIGSRIYFGGTDVTNGTEPWISDGTAAGTVLLRNIAATTSSSSPANFRQVNGAVYFSANDVTNGAELWKTDGTTAGTVLVRNISPGAGSSSPASFTDNNGLLIFLATDGTTGFELWRSDGTADGTRLIADQATHTADGTYGVFRSVGNTLYFSASTPSHGMELWKSTGGAFGQTTLVKDINPGINSSTPTSMASLGSTLLFAATTAANGTELWKSDGTEAGTVLLSDIRSGTTSSSPTSLTSVNNSIIYFSAGEATNGTELWKTDGTTGGTVMVTNLNSGTASSNPANLSAFSGKVVFSATTAAAGTEIFISDGSAAGTMLLADIVTGTGSSSPTSFAVVGSTLYFLATTTANGQELWKTDGTTAGTVLVKDVNGTTSGSSITNLTAAGSTLFFSANNGTTGAELWKSDGTTAGTVLVLDIYSGVTSSNPSNMINLNGALIFSATTLTSGTELWRSDGTSAGTGLLKEISTASLNSSPAGMVLLGNTVYFRATSSLEGIELWKTDGTTAGTVLVFDLWSGSNSSNPQNITVTGSRVYMTAASPDFGVELHLLDLTPPVEIAVEQPVGTDLVDGTAQVSFGHVTPGTVVTRTITVRNTGGFDLNLGAITVDGTASADYAVTAPGSTLLAGGTSTTFNVTFTAPATPGTKPAALRIANNDANENPFDIALNASVFVVSAAEIALEFPAGTNLSDDGAVVNYGVTQVNQPVTRTFTIRNTGTDNLVIHAVGFDGTGASQFQAAAPSSSSIAPGGSATVDVLFRPTTSGTFQANLNVTSNDTDEAIFGVRLHGICSHAYGPVTLLGDLNTVPVGSTITGMVVSGTTAYYVYNSQLWRTNGTEAGTTTVTNTATSITNLTMVGNRLFFSGSSTSTGVELWAADAAGTTTAQVMDINSGVANSSPTSLTALGSTVYFAATSSTSGTELWKSDGTSAGTVLVKDINAGTLNASPTGLTVMNGLLYFAATDATNGTELWRSDGTSAGTVMVADINTGTPNSSPANLLAIGNVLYFTATAASGTELYKYDGTTVTQVLDINSGTASSTPSLLTNVGGTLFFRATTATGGQEVWKSDGTAGGTVQARDIFPGSASSNPANFAALGGTLYFTATEGTQGTELWKSNGTLPGTVMVKNIFPGSGSSSPTQLVSSGGLLYFYATDGTSGFELWRSDGTDPGTLRVEDVNAGANSSSVTLMTAFTNGVLFGANDGVIGSELWISDGSATGTYPVRNSLVGNTSSAVANVTRSGSKVYFSASDGVNGTELWSTDGTAAGTSLLKNINTSAGTSSSPANLTDLGGTLFFSANDGFNGIELWKSDGTNAGTVLVADISSAAGSSSPALLRAMGGTLYFSASASSTQGSELWKSDGTAAGTVLVKDINPAASGSSSINNLTVIGSTLYFRATDGVTGTELWSSDGTTAGTNLLLDINTSAAGASSNPGLFTQVGSNVFFTADDGVNGIELWKTDGTTAGTVLVKDINPGLPASGPGSLIAYNGKLYFSATDGVNGAELWESDGTAAGTVMLKDINPAATSSSPGNFAVLNGVLYFGAQDSFGNELWKTDGTAAGTIQVRDINPGASGSTPTNMLLVGDQLYFRATTALQGAELWSTDGTTAGTRLVMDLAIGAVSSTPGLPVVNGSKMVFAASLTDLGTEIFALDLVATPEIALYDGANDTAPERQDNGTAYSYGTLSSPQASSFTIKNTGNSSLYISDIVTSGPQAASFLVQSKPEAYLPLLPGATATFQVLATLEGPAAQTAIVSVLCNDANEASFDIPVAVSVLDSIAPVISAPTTYLIGDAGQLSMSLPDLRDIVIFTDNLPGGGIITQNPPLNGAILSIGQSVTVQFSATDASGNPSNTVSTQVRMGIGQPNTGGVAWAQTGGGIGSEGTTSRAVVTPDGGVVVAGAFGSSPFTIGTGAEQVTLTSAGNTDVFVAKYALDGKLQWVRSGGGASTDSVNALQVLSDGSVVVAGVFSTNATFSGNSITAGGGSDTFLVRYQADGTLVWARGFGGTGTDAPVSVVELTDGNLALAGTISSTTSLILPGGVTLQNIGSNATDQFLIKWNKTTGNALWGRMIGSSATSESSTGLTPLPQAGGGVVLAGNFSSATLSFSGVGNTLTNLGAAGNSDWYAVKYDSSGILIWARNLGGGTSVDSLALGRVLASGDLILGGSFTSSTVTFGAGGSVTQSFATRGGTDAVLLRVSGATGDLVWAKRVGGLATDVVSAFVLLPDQSIALAGTFSGGSTQIGQGEVNATTLTAPTTNAKIYVGRFQGSDGSLMWASSSGGTAAEAVIGVDLIGTDGIGVAGSFGTSASVFGTTTLTSSGSNDVFVAKFARTDGSVVWAKSGGGVNSESLHAFAALQNGSAMLVGTFQPPSATFGLGGSDQVTLTNADSAGTNTDFFFVRLHGGGVEEPVSPLVSLLPPSGLSTTSLTFSAKVDSRGQDTTVQVDYGPTTSYGTTVALIDVPAGLITETRRLDLTGLAPDSTLNFRLRATNSAGTTTSPNQVITTYPDVEISVEQPAGTPITDGASTSFGTVAVGSSATQTFTVKNESTAGTLTGLALTKDGLAAADFALGTLGAVTLAPGESTTFTVTYTPSAAGTRTAALHLTSNDGDENPYDITLVGDNLLAAAFPTAGTVPVTSAGYSVPAGRSLGFSLGFAPTLGSTLTVVSNTSTNPISGTFLGLPQGGIIAASFGGQTFLYQANYAGGDGNDLVLTRAFDWAWMKGSSSGNQVSTYGTQGTPAAANTPGSRAGAHTWTGADGTLWLFGGNQSGAVFSDLWQYFPATGHWVWRKGSSLSSATGVYGTLGVEASTNLPGARSGGATWTDATGKLWLFGGTSLNDLWRYDPATNNWTWMHGSSSIFALGTYGTQGVPAAANTPGNRQHSVAWTGADGNLWLFGGVSGSYLTDLWKYDIATGMWTWMKGSSSTSQFGTYGTKGVAAANNAPGSRAGSAGWTDAEGKLWLFGGIGYGSNIAGGTLGDLWRYDPATNNWTWMSGSGAGSVSPNGVYGTQAQPSTANTPGYRQYAKGWTDLQGRLWMFGGFGNGALGATAGELSDLWYFDTASNQWAWVKGSQFTQNNGIYGSQGVPAVTNSPGARQQLNVFPPNAQLRDLWLMGGTGFAATGFAATGLNDLWRLNLPNIPSVTTLAAAPVTSAGATLNAQVIPDGTETFLRFTFGTAVNLSGAATSAWQSVGTSTTNGTLNLSLLSPSTTYYFRAEVFNNAGTATGALLSFTTPSAPDIAIADGTISLVGGASTVDFGSVAITSALPRLLTISNSGTETLSGISYTLDGTDAASFTVTALPTSLAGAATAGFNVTLNTGTTAGPRSATLHILSNDPDEPSFDIALTATNSGLTAYAMWAADHSLSGDGASPSGDGDGDGLNNLQEFAYGLDPNITDGGSLVITGGVLTNRGTPIPRIVPQAFGVNYQAAYTCNVNAMAAGYTFTVQFSGDLATWFNNTSTPTVQATDGNVQAVTVPYPFLLPNRQKARFFRVVVSPP